ncbi:MAG: S1C family serine protease [Parcubacteria group bacterium]
MNNNKFHNYYNLVLISFLVLIFSALFGYVGAQLYFETNKDFRQENIEETVNTELEKEMDKQGKDFFSQEEMVVSAVKEVSPAVVSVLASRDLSDMQNQSSPFEDEFFREFFGDEFRVEPSPEGDTRTQQLSSGSGFIISEDGYIVTNKHVVAYEDVDYSVILNDDESYTATVVDRDTITDLAVLKIEVDEPLPTVELGDSSNLEVGQTVIAIGNALGEFSNTVSTGVISGLSRTVIAGGAGNTEKLVNVIQTDASINPGNSGGPLLDSSGRVIGINTAMASRAQNIGFAITINEVKSAIESIYETGRIVRPWLGVRYIIINEEIAKQNDLSVDYGALIVRASREQLAVIPGSPADKTGLRENDIILEVNGEEVDSQEPLSYLISQYSPGEIVELKVLSQGEEKAVDLELGERE